MAIFKCKMCGGDLDVMENQTVAECEYCGTNQTVPSSRDEEITNLFNRAELLRKKCDFDRAEATYEKVLELDSREAEAYWGVILCKYGVEYVEDPYTKEKVPTCHRTSYDAIVTDEYYKSALEHADVVQREIYEKEARRIDGIQRRILSISATEEPYDVFICYKETDENGKRTRDSSLANEIYHELRDEGFKVFYSAITLEEKLGEEYEPCIFSALNSAKVMLVIGTKKEYFNAVWVKNEWSRFLKIIKKDRTKRLIPCYRDMDAYDLPEEFAHLQAQDMAKIGFITDIVRGIKKLIRRDEGAKDINQSPQQGFGGRATDTQANSAGILRRAQIFLEDGDFESADEYAEKCLDISPEMADAYLVKLLAQLRLKSTGELEHYPRSFTDNPNYQKAVRYGDSWLRSSLTGLAKERDYNEAVDLCLKGDGESFESAKRLLLSLGDYKDSIHLLKSNEEKIQQKERLELKEQTDRNLLAGFLTPVAESACKVAKQQKKVDEIKKDNLKDRKKHCTGILVLSAIFVLSFFTTGFDILPTLSALTFLASAIGAIVMFFIYKARYSKKMLVLFIILTVATGGFFLLAIPFIMIYEANYIKKLGEKITLEEKRLFDLKKQFSVVSQNVEDPSVKEMILTLANMGKDPAEIARLVAENKIDYIE
ncbi:MAG: TIR domain-containing protein [Clostridia bacterium]|nr:TIR domain-containing protein [Clostridia bacterium]